MKRFLVVSNMYPSPEAPYFGVFVERQVRALRALGVECDLAVSHRRGGGRATAAAGKYAGLATTALRSAGASRRLDAVVAHFAFPTGAIGIAAARRAKAPVAVVCHGGDVDPAGKTGAIRRATRAVLERADVVVAVSRAIARDAESFGARPNRIVVASMGYDAETFVPRPRAEARAALGLDADGTYAVYVGNLIERKGAGVIARAAQRLEARLPGLRWLMVGGGDPRPYHHPALRFAGSVPPDRVPLWLAAADVAVVPSLREPFGVAAVEALACGIPVVASRTGGLAEIVADGETGILIEPGDADALAAAVTAVVADRALHERLAKAGPDAASPHTARRQAQRLIDALEGRSLPD